MDVTGSDAWNSQKSDVGGQESGAKARAKCGRVYPSRRGAATKAGAVLGSKTVISRMTPRTVCLFPGRAYLWLMTVHFPFQNTYSALPSTFFARVAPTPVASPRLLQPQQ